MHDIIELSALHTWLGYGKLFYIEFFHLKPVDFLHFFHRLCLFCWCCVVTLATGRFGATTRTDSDDTGVASARPRDSDTTAERLHATRTHIVARTAAKNARLHHHSCRLCATEACSKHRTCELHQHISDESLTTLRSPIETTGSLSEFQARHTSEHCRFPSIGRISMPSHEPILLPDRLKKLETLVEIAECLIAL